MPDIMHINNLKIYIFEKKTIIYLEAKKVCCTFDHMVKLFN